MHIWWLIALLSFMLLFRLGSSPIYILDEAKNAQCAREMLQHNDWVVPTFNGELRTDKPVLHYYFMMIAYKVFGINEFSARFFSAILGVLTVIITYYIRHGRLCKAGQGFNCSKFHGFIYLGSPYI